MSLIIGLTNLSAKWGERHGFSTVTYTDNTEILTLHEKSIKDKSEENLKSPLTLFWMTKEKAAEVFGKPPEK